ncbi:hypothetical protein JXA84_00200 [candidate division WOR-3 bacterium]|nr:hypothetical protein [candidate division WOR-3 bacterium]
MNRFVLNKAIFIFFLVGLSCSPSESVSGTVANPRKLFVVDSLIGTCTSVASGPNNFLAAFDALSKQTLFGYEWTFEDTLFLTDRGYLIREKYFVRDIKYSEGIFLVVEGIQGILLVEKREGFEAVGRVTTQDTNTVFFDACSHGDDLYCACGERGVLCFHKRNSIGSAFSYSLTDSMRCEGSVSHVLTAGDFIFAGLWDTKSVCVFEKGELAFTIENLSGIAGIASDGEKLFIAAENDGLLIYGLKEEERGKLLKAVNGISAFDVELSGDFVYVACDVKGLKVYDKNGDLAAYCEESSPAEKVSVYGQLILVSHAMQIPKGYLWLIKNEGLQ